MCRYTELVLGLVVDADTFDEEEAHRRGLKEIPEQHLPFDCSQLASYDFRLGPCATYPAYATKRRSTRVLDLQEIQSWWHKSLALSMSKLSALDEKVRVDPFAAHGARRTSTDLSLEQRKTLKVLRGYNLDFKPLAVDGDGSCLVHAVSTALVGSQVYYDALRYGILQELSRHRSYYTRTGQIDDSFRKRFRTRLEQDRDGAVLMGLKDRAEVAAAAVRALDTVKADYGGCLYTRREVDRALQRARPCEGQRLGQDRFLEDIHLTALANLLRRPIWVLADGCRIFLPLRHDPEEVRQHGEVPPPLLLAHGLGHYMPLCLRAGPGEYWRWLGEQFPDDPGIIKAFKQYAEQLRGEAEDEEEEEEEAEEATKSTLPEWLEDIFVYIIRKSWEVLDATLEENEVSEADRSDFLRLFGDPKALSDVGAWLFEGLGERELSGTFRNEPTLVQLYRALGFRVLPYADRDQPHGSSKQSSDYVKLSVRPHLLDLAKMQRVVTALYAFRSLPPDTTARPSEDEEEEWGYVPIRGGQDVRHCGRVSNGVMQEAIDWGVAHLYCDLQGWTFHRQAGADPTAFLRGEEARLKLKFSRLTGLDFNEQADRDEAEHRSTRRSDDVRSQLPQALLAMQHVLATRPYPGRGEVQASQVVLLGCPSLSSSTSVPSKPHLSLDEIPLESTTYRRRLLRVLISWYGLPMDCPGFEGAASTVSLPELHDAARARTKFLLWVRAAMSERRRQQQHEEGSAIIEVEREAASTSGRDDAKQSEDGIIERVVLRPLATPRALPPLRVFVRPEGFTEESSEEQRQGRPTPPTSSDVRRAGPRNTSSSSTSSSKTREPLPAQLDPPVLSRPPSKRSPRPF